MWISNQSSIQFHKRYLIWRHMGFVEFHGNPMESGVHENVLYVLWNFQEPLVIRNGTSSSTEFHETLCYLMWQLHRSTDFYEKFHGSPRKRYAIWINNFKVLWNFLKIVNICLASSVEFCGIFNGCPREPGVNAIGFLKVPWYSTEPGDIWFGVPWLVMNGTVSGFIQPLRVLGASAVARHW